MSFEARLARGELIHEPVALVAAHPDDEVRFVSRARWAARVRDILAGRERDGMDHCAER